MKRLQVLLALLLALPGLAEEKLGDKVVRASLVPGTTAVEPGKPFKIGIRLVMDPGWHTYYKEPGDAGQATRARWTLPEGFQAGEIEWPAYRSKLEAGNILSNYYEGETLLSVTITPPATLQAKKVVLRAQVDWLACQTQCVPGGADLSLELPVGKPSPANSELFAKYPPLPPPAPSAAPTPPAPQLRVMLLYALIGGLILNIMPCVLPVISLKIFGFIQDAHRDPRKIFRLGLTFTAGVVASFWVLAAIVVLLQSAGRQIGWGFQLQNPIFVLALCVVVLVFGMSLFGVFEVLLPSSIWTGAGRLSAKSGHPGAFFNGALATVLATPCTAPFLAPAVGYAFSRPAAEIFAVFTAVALGLALPYLILTAKPGWMARLPRPGPWMERAKQLMGFFMLATLLWLLWVLGAHLGWKGIVWAGAFLLAVALACWLIGGFPARKPAAWLLAAGVVACGAWLFLPRALAKEQQGGIAWETFTPSHLERRLAEGKTVLLDFTAEWCLTCKANEATVLETAEVRGALERLGVVPMKADWTGSDPQITRLLAQFGRSGVPLYVIYPGRDPANPIVLPEVITKSMVIEKLEQAAAAGSD